MIAEVTNTPWGERTTYVLDRDPGNPNGPITGRFAKAMHVSPFQPMEQNYEISTHPPGERLLVRIDSFDDGEPALSASMTLRRHEMTSRRMCGLLLRYPPMTMATLARIYGQALRLRLGGAPRFAHPGRSAP